MLAEDVLYREVEWDIADRNAGINRGIADANRTLDALQIKLNELHSLKKLQNLTKLYESETRATQVTINDLKKRVNAEDPDPHLEILIELTIDFEKRLEVICVTKQGLSAEIANLEREMRLSNPYEEFDFRDLDPKIRLFEGRVRDKIADIEQRAAGLIKNVLDFITRYETSGLPACNAHVVALSDIYEVPVMVWTPCYNREEGLNQVYEGPDYQINLGPKVIENDQYFIPTHPYTGNQKDSVIGSQFKDKYPLQLRLKANHYDLINS